MENQPSPKVSVIIPAYNQAQFLDRAIGSVLNQTYQDFEIIVIDDGSIDDTRKIAGKYQERLRYIWQENKGLAGARNTGIRAARGMYIGLLDSDDEWMPDYLEKMVSLAMETPDASVFYCAAQGIDIEGNPLPQIFGAPAAPPDDFYPAMVRANFLIPSTILMKTGAAVDAGLFDEHLRSCEDWDLWLRLLPGHRFVGLDECLVCYRVHGSSLSTNPAGMQLAARTVIQKNFGADNGEISEWSGIKKRAYGGLYFYQAWTSILRKGDWEAAGDHLRNALIFDRELATDLDFYYEILLGRQPVGYRGTREKLSLANNVAELERILGKVSSSEPFSLQGAAVRRIYGTAYYAAGLLAYNTQDNHLARKYLASALKYRQELWHEMRFMKVFVRSLLPIPVLGALKTVKSGFRR